MISMASLPDSMDECLYFTRRATEDSKIIAWVSRVECPKCKKGKIGLPIKKNGKVDKKATVYECPECKYQEDRTEHEDNLKMDIIYTCPHCSNQGETQTEYKRYPFKGTKAYIFTCQKCNEKIPITKKMKKLKEKKKK